MEMGYWPEIYHKGRVDGKLEVAMCTLVIPAYQYRVGSLSIFGTVEEILMPQIQLGVSIDKAIVRAGSAHMVTCVWL